jgi:hypothetical protein
MTVILFRRLPAAAALAALTLLLSACWVPEHYMARIKIERDGSYKVYMEGTAVEAETARAVRTAEEAAKAAKGKSEEAKKQPQADPQEPLRKQIAQLKAQGLLQEANVIGGGRVHFILAGAWRLDRSLLVFNELKEPLAYSVLPDGTLRLYVKDAPPSREAASLGVKTEGELSIVLAEGIQVLEHNAQKTPTSPRGAYRWNIDGKTTQVPFLHIRLPAAGGAPEPMESQAQKKLAHH